MSLTFKTSRLYCEELCNLQQVDLFRAYHQIPVEPADIPKTAVITPYRLLEITRPDLPMLH